MLAMTTLLMLLLLSLAVPSIDAVIQQQHSFVTKAAVGIGALSSTSTSTSTAAAASPSTTNNNNNAPSASASASASAVIEQYYQEIFCPAPKSCSVEVQPNSSSSNNDNNSNSRHQHQAECSYSTLKGLAQTRQQMEAKSNSFNSNSNSNSNNEYSHKAATTTGIKLQLAHVRLEEAAVGCALLRNHNNNINNSINQEVDIANISSGSSEQQQRTQMKYTTNNFIQDKLQQFAHGAKVEVDDDKEGDEIIICPTPKSCNFILNTNSNSNSANKKSEQQTRSNSSSSSHNVCDMKHLHQLHNTGIAIDTSLDDIDIDIGGINNSNRDGSNNGKQLQLERLEKRLELADVDAEAATVGCVLMLQRQVDELLRSKDGHNLHHHHHPQQQQHLTNGEASSKKLDHPNQQQQHHQLQEEKNNHPSSPIISKLASHFERLKEDDEQFTYFLHQNLHRLTTLLTTPPTTPPPTTNNNKNEKESNNNNNEFKTLIHKHQTIQQKRYKIEAVLNFAGKGEVPAIIWQEQISRERAVERLLEDELGVRSRLLELILDRLVVVHVHNENNSNNGDDDDLLLKMSQLDLRDKPKEEVEDTRNYWDWLADKLEAEQEEEHLGRERDEEKKRVKEEEEERARRVKEIGKYSPQPTPLRKEECRDGNVSGEGGEQSCTATTNTNANAIGKQQTPSPTSISDDNETATIMMDRMKRDIELLRSKAQMAPSTEEKEARLGLVKELEKQLKLMMS